MEQLVWTKLSSRMYTSVTPWPTKDGYAPMYGTWKADEYFLAKDFCKAKDWCIFRLEPQQTGEYGWKLRGYTTSIETAKEIAETIHKYEDLKGYCDLPKVACYYPEEVVSNTQNFGLTDCTICKVEVKESSGDELVIYTDNGIKFRVYHNQDCCENVWLEDIPDVKQLVGSQIKTVYASTNKHDTNGGSATWTFLHVITTAGYFTFRWVGESNGYYSEEVSAEVLPIMKGVIDET